MPGQDADGGGRGEAKPLGEDNMVKSVEVERLRCEVEGLRGLLLPHYRV